MSDQTLTFEEVNAHIEEADFNPYQPGGDKAFTASTATAAPASVLQNVCGIYKIVRPILALVSSLPILPAKWKAAIKTFMGLMDGLCP
jgi:hypothetical protein